MTVRWEGKQPCLSLRKQEGVGCFLKKAQGVRRNNEERQECNSWQEVFGDVRKCQVCQKRPLLGKTATSNDLYFLCGSDREG